jgi:hypothetical protein
VVTKWGHHLARQGLGNIAIHSQGTSLEDLELVA